MYVPGWQKALGLDVGCDVGRDEGTAECKTTTETERETMAAEPVANVNKAAFLALAPFRVEEEEVLLEEKREEPRCMLVESVEANVEEERVAVTLDSTLVVEVCKLGMGTEIDKDTCNALVLLLLLLL